MAWTHACRAVAQVCSRRAKYAPVAYIDGEIASGASMSSYVHIYISSVHISSVNISSVYFLCAEFLSVNKYVFSSIHIVVIHICIYVAHLEEEAGDLGEGAELAPARRAEVGVVPHDLGRFVSE